jgi:hypothetical protein
MTEPVRTPHAIPFQPVSTLVEHWCDVRTRSLLARHAGGQPHPDDLFAELAYGARIVQEVASGRWCVIAELLRAGAVESWIQIGNAMGITETDARDGFRAWIRGQVSLRRRTSTIGLSDAEAEELTALAEAVTW